LGEGRSCAVIRRPIQQSAGNAQLAGGGAEELADLRDLA
jgi:hypothetical protein